MSWVQTATGRAFDLVEPDWRQVDFSEAGDALARIARFAGHVPAGPYSVAQHCVIGADLVFRDTGDTEAAGAFLIHDAHEAYCGDIPTPVAVALGGVAVNAIWQLKRRLDRAIFRAAGLGVEGCPPRLEPLIKAYDLALLKVERDQLLGPVPMPWHRDIETAMPLRMTGKLTVWPWPKAADAYRDRLEKYLPRRARDQAPRQPAPIPARSPKLLEA